MTDTFATDWKDMSGLVSGATYTPSTLDGLGNPIYLDFVVTTPVRVEQPQPSWGQYRRWITTVRIPAEFCDFQPKPRDQINWGYTTYTGGDTITFQVTDVLDPPRLGSDWVLTCDWLDFNLPLSHTITWRLPLDTTDTYGSPITDQSGTLPPMVCAIQETSKEEIVFQGVVQGFRYRYSIWVEDELRLPVGTIGTDERGYVYQVESQRNRHRLDELNEILAVVNP